MTLGQLEGHKMLWTVRQWNKWDKRVRELETEGLTRSDAQGATDCEYLNGRVA